MLLTRRLLLLATLGGVLWLFWNTPWIYPIKLLVVFFHEAAHAAATLGTGGQVHEMVVSHMQGGHVISRGGNRFLVLNAGYLGSLFIGAGLYLAAVFSRRTEILTALLAGLVLAVTIAFVRNLFGLVFGVATGVALGLAARFLGRGGNEIVCRLIGLASMIYTPLDIISDTIARRHLMSDAAMLAAEFGGATWLWGLGWLGICLLVTGMVLYADVRHGRSSLY